MLKRRTEEGPQRTPPICRILDGLIGAVLLFVVVWAPWALGCTTRATVWTLSFAGCVLGGLLVAKRLLCFRLKFEMPDWIGSSGSTSQAKLICALGIVILAYVLTSAINKKADVVYTHNEADPNLVTGVDLKVTDAIPWLPSSYDSRHTWSAFVRYLGLFGMFWAARDWLLTKSRQERHRDLPDGQTPFPTDQMKLLLWTLSISGTALAVVGILQRLDGTPKLLWLFEQHNETHFTFGPFAYRGNGAQYLNLIWPLTLGFWWALREQKVREAGVNRRAGGDSHLMLVPCVVLMITGTVVTTSRGGSAVMAALLLVSMLILATARRATLWLRVGLLATVLAAAFASFVLGGENLQQRLNTLRSDKLSGRGRIYEVANRMERDFPVWGSGAETFASMYGFYRDDEHEEWHAYAHNDWLETQITFGRVGAPFIYALLGLIPLASLLGAGIYANREFRAMVLLGMIGMLGHATMDFPFQIHGLLYSFVVLCAIASVTTRRS